MPSGGNRSEGPSGQMLSPSPGHLGMTWTWRSGTAGPPAAPVVQEVDTSALDLGRQSQRHPLRRRERAGQVLLAHVGRSVAWRRGTTSIGPGAAALRCRKATAGSSAARTVAGAIPR